MKNIHSICRKVLALTEAELADAERQSQEQAGYMHPLKMATARKVTAAGRHNIAVLSKLRELKATITADSRLQSDQKKTPETDELVGLLSTANYTDAARYAHMQGWARELERRLTDVPGYWQRQCKLAEEENDRLRNELSMLRK